MAANALTKYLNVKSGRLLDEYHVRYENRAKHSGRQVKLTYMLSLIHICVSTMLTLHLCHWKEVTAA